MPAKTGVLLRPTEVAMNEKKIGLCLSGGGHRATAFSLGVLLYLADVGMHQNIHTISSVSGGSLTSGFFATRSKSLRNHTAAEMEDAVAELAARITGRPWFFWIGLGAILLALLGWILNVIGWLHFPLSFWE